jgi:hypothetical protein
MIRTLFCLAMAVLALASPAQADTRAVYTIRDIPVDESAPSVIEAQRAALARARQIGARRLIEKITLAPDRREAGGVQIGPALADRLVAAVDVQEETRGGGRYIGVLSAILNPREVRAYLDERGIPYVDRQAPLAMLAPVGNDDDDLAWASAWPERARTPLAPYVTATSGFYYADSDWPELEPELSALGAERAVIAKLVGTQGNYAVSLILVTASGRTDLGTTRRVASLDDAVAGVSGLLDMRWKQNSMVRSTVRSVVEASVLYTSIAEWNTLRRALARSPLISEFRTLALANDGALVKFAFAGDRARLERDLRQRGVALDADSAGWLLTSAVSGAP